MTDTRISRLLEQEAAQEWRSTPDLWPRVRASIQHRSREFSRPPEPLDHDTHYEAAAARPAKQSTEPARGSWPWELGKMAAGGAVVALVAFILAAVFSGQQGSLPGTGDDEEVEPGPSPVTEGEVLITRWSDDRDGYELAAVDARTGEMSDRLPAISLGSSGMNTPVGISEDGSKLAVISADESIGNPFAGGTQTWPLAELLTIIDTESGETIEHTLPGDGWVPLFLHPRFSPDGETLALVYDRAGDSTVKLFDSESGDLISERSLDGHLAFLEFHPDGDEIVVYYQDTGDEPGVSEPLPPVVAALNANSLDTHWRQTLDGLSSGNWCLADCDEPVQERETISLSPGIALDQQDKHLYIAHVDQPVITRISLSDQVVETIEYAIEGDPPGDIDFGSFRGGYMMLHVDPRDDRLYLLGGGPDVHSLGFIILDLEENRARVRVSGNMPQSGVPANTIQLIPDHSGLILAGHRFIGKFDLETGNFLDSDRPWNWTVRTSLTLNGEPILLAVQDDPERAELGVVDIDAMEIVDSWTASDQTSWASLPGWSR